MPYLPIKLPPGVRRIGTEYESKGRFYDANWMRWHKGTMRPIGGWEKVLTLDTDADTVEDAAHPLIGSPRYVVTWRDNDGDNWGAIGTSHRLYVTDGTGLYDITPDGFAAGSDGAVYSSTYGDGVYGLGVYGLPDDARLGDVAQTIGLWSLDVWGHNLVACANHDGKIYEWNPDDGTGTAAAQISASPVKNAYIFVTDERFLVALGGSEYNYGGASEGSTPVIRQVRWSDREDNSTWIASATNQSGDFLLNTSGAAQCGVQLRGQSLILTKIDAHVMRYIGPPLIYGFERVGDVGIIGPHAIAEFNGKAAWMSSEGFHLFDGYIQDLPCEVNDYIFSDLNYSQANKIVAGHNREWNEIWWFYPSASSYENDRYVIWSYSENHWSIGNLARGAWDDAGVLTYPLACSSLPSWENSPTFAVSSNFDVKVSNQVTYLVDGVQYTLAANTVFDTGTSEALAADKWGVAILSVDSSGTTYVDWAGVDYASENAAKRGLLAVGEISGDVVLGYMTVKTGVGTTWTAGTDALEGGTGGNPSSDTNYYVCQAFGYLYRHEYGYQDDGTTRVGSVYAETGPIELGRGDQVMHVRQIIADEDTVGEVSLSFATRFTPNHTEYTTTKTIDADGYTDLRLTGRQLKMKFINTVDEDFRVGEFRVEVVPGGLR